MSYYMRFIITDEKPINLTLIQEALRAVDLEYYLEREENNFPEMADLVYGGEILGEVEITRPGNELFDNELAELREDIDEFCCRGCQRILDVLDQAREIIALRVLWQKREPQATLERIAPLWTWLFDKRDGLLQVDGEGYYDKSGLVCEAG